MGDLFGGGGGSKNQKVTTTSAPWGPVQAPLTTAINDFTKLYKSGGTTLDYYPQSTVAPLAPERQQAWSMIAQRAQNGSPLTDSAKGYFSDLMGGKYLNADAPGFSQVLERARQGANSTYAAGGRYGSGAHDQAVTDALAPILYQNYAAERGYQDQAARFAPQLAQQDYFDANQLAQVGNERQAYAQDLTNDNVNRWNWDEKKQINAIQLLRDFMTGVGGGTTTSTQPKQGGSGGNGFMDFLGTALQLGSNFIK